MQQLEADNLSWPAALASIAALLILVAPVPAVTISTVRVGNPGNAADPSTGGLYGSVGYVYDIGADEVTNSQYVEFLDAKAGSDPLGLYNPSMASDSVGGILRSNVNGRFTYAAKPNMGDKPVNYVSFYDAIRFTNWLANGQGDGSTETGAYTLLGATAVPSNGATIARNAGAAWSLTSENEWYKAAYYDPRTAVQGGPKGGTNYWIYPTASNSPPQIAAADPLGNLISAGGQAANFRSGASWNGLTGNVTSVGSAGPLSTSFYGTSDQAGNVWEWNESSLFGGSNRGLRGGGYRDSSQVFTAQFRNGDGLGAATDEASFIGFRVSSIADIPEPSSLVLAGLGLSGLAARSWRRRQTRAS